MDGTSIIPQPIENEIYTSSGNVMVVNSRTGISDWYDCNWTTLVLASSSQIPLTTTSSEPIPTFQSEYAIFNNTAVDHLFTIQIISSFSLRPAVLHAHNIGRRNPWENFR